MSPTSKSSKRIHIGQGTWSVPPQQDKMAHTCTNCIDCAYDEENEMANCCGCGRPVPDEEDFGNNADVADTCCKACWDAHNTAYDKFEMIRDGWNYEGGWDDEFFIELYEMPLNDAWRCVLEDQTPDGLHLTEYEVNEITAWLRDFFRPRYNTWKNSK